MLKRFGSGILVAAFFQAGLALAANPFEEREVKPLPAKSAFSNPPREILQDGSKENQTPGSEKFTFNATGFPGFYDASRDVSSAYNVPLIVKDIPKMWASYGKIFKKVGADLGMDPYALAAFCVFESYNSRTHNFNSNMTDISGTMYAAGIAATQAQDVKGTRVPGLNVFFPKTTAKTADVLKKNPEYAIRCLASEFKGYYGKIGDMAKTFPKVALPSWKNPKTSIGNYGSQAQYVSRAYVFYNAFRAADGR